jgi:hypothetical protein
VAQLFSLSGLHDMDTFTLIIIAYLVFGAGLLWLSVRLARRIRSARFRAAIHAAVFALWFSPGVAVGEGGAMPAPLWLVFLDGTSRLVSDLSARTSGALYNPWPLHYWLNGMFWGIIILAIVWVVVFLVILCMAGIRRRWLRKNERAA